MERRTDERISEWFREEAERISVPADMKTEIDRRIRNAERRTVMKKFSRKKAVLIAAAVALIGSVTAAAAGRVASMESHSNRNDQVTDYAAIAGVEEKVGFAFPSLEEFSNGFRFAYALPGENSDYDEDGNVLSTYQSVDLTYTDGAQEITFLIYPTRPYEEADPEPSAVKPVWTGEKEGVSLTVTRTVYRFVPPDYELTEEDLQAQEDGSVIFSYGSAQVEENVAYNCGLEKDGLTYLALGFDLTMEPEELAEMTAQLAAAGE